MTIREFHLGDILSVTTRRYVSPTGSVGITWILEFMTGRELLVTEFPAAMDACAPVLLAQHPDLAAVEVPAGRFGDTRQSAREAADAWLAAQVARYGKTRLVEPLPAVIVERPDE